MVAIFSEKLLAGQQPIINGDGKQTRDYVYVGDVALANLGALHYTENAIFNIGTAIESDVNELFSHLNRLTGGSMQEHHGPPKSGEQRRSVISYEKAKQEMGWEPQIGLKEGLKKTVKFFQGK